MRWGIVVGFAWACGGSPSPAPAPDHAAHDHASTPHAHGAPHGGQTKTTGDLHVEAKIMATGVMLWLSDAEERPLAVDGVTATAVVQAGGEVQEVTFTPMGDHLHGLITLELGKPARVVVTLRRGGVASSVAYDDEAVGTALHDHTPGHGGVVGMFGDFHVELVRDGARLRFFVSDAYRRPLTGGVAGVVAVADRHQPLVFDAATGALEGEAAGDPVVLEATVGGLRFRMTFPADGHPTAAPLP